MSSVASLKRAANNVVTQSLVLQRNQNLLIFADAESQACAEVIAEAAYEIDSLATIFSVPRFFQSRFGINGKLPLPVEAGIREADAILISLSDRPEHWPCRRSILLAAWNRRTKVAHAPGLTVDHLRWADVDYQRIGQQSQDLALALIFGQQLEIISADSQGRQYRLAVETGGWDPCPMVSDGIIREGSWANLPPGETYIIPQTARGKSPSTALCQVGSWPLKKI